MSRTERRYWSRVVSSTAESIRKTPHRHGVALWQFDYVLYDLTWGKVDCGIIDGINETNIAPPDDAYWRYDVIGSLECPFV